MSYAFLIKEFFLSRNFLGSSLMVTACSVLLSVMPTLAQGQTSTDTVIIIDGDTLGRYNPILGHGRNGDSHIYQGLYRVETGVFEGM